MLELTRDGIGAQLDYYSETAGETTYIMPGIMCQYLERDYEGSTIPSCLYGHVLIDLGVDMEWLDSMESKGINNVLKSLGVTDERLINAVQMSQLTQDTCLFTWAQCVQVFYEFLVLSPYPTPTIV